MLCVSRSPAPVVVLPAWPCPGPIPTPAAARERDLSKPRALLDGRPNKVFGLVVVVRLLKDDMPLRDDALAEVRSLCANSGVGTISGSRPENNSHFGRRRIEIAVTVRLAPRLPRACLRLLRVQPADGPVMPLAAAAIAVDRERANFAHPAGVERKAPPQLVAGRVRVIARLTERAFHFVRGQRQLLPAVLLRVAKLSAFGAADTGRAAE